MNIYIHRSSINGTISAPSSKSYTIRGLMCAALANGESQLICPLTAEDTDAAARVLCQMGAVIVQNKSDWRVRGGKLHAPDSDLFCGDSAATLRFMTAICSLVPGTCQLTAGDSLSKRPVKPLVDALRQIGVDAASNGDSPPVTVRGGKLMGGLIETPGHISSQFVSALLLVASCAERGMTIKLTTPLESRPYVLMTLECLEKFGVKVKVNPELDRYEIAPQSYRPARYEIEGDWSSASCFLVLGAVAGNVTVNNLNPRSLQADRALVDILQKMGAVVSVAGKAVTMKQSRLAAADIDLSDCIDLLPAAAVLAAVAQGTSRLTGIGRARLKESDRVLAVQQGLERMGFRVEVGKDSMTITGGKPHGAIIDSHNDHRIAMAFSVLGVLAGDTTITGAECVNKTFSEFWSLLENVGGKVSRDGKQ